ncbi:superoxide dismutase family protein [Gracilibacillus sp. S3-1-1]|uniref:Superoxide dismutase family protein n=1 Tax=Gracilibacillus pellucidus TaxID=3095368 RepID=A0ACC6M1I1_9BACI|nr:superoxide dismutase family protein [Gracilibacillus sp. S3-1-1]MDX8044778.1 superoxide dismutase family protein [Gracilibacillus sp. S3-1-1]
MKYSLLYYCSIVLCILLVGCQGEERSPIEVRLYNQDLDAVGTANFKEQDDSVAVEIKVEGLAPGFHGIHIHEFAKCEAPDFQSAGNHFNPEGKEHGLMHPDGAHLGDLPNIEVAEDGTADVELEVQGATLMEGDKSLLREDGTSIIIHADADDGISQPAGNAGERIVCGVISIEESADKEKPTDPTESNVDEDEEDDN